MSKLLYLLWTSKCAGKPLLNKTDDSLRQCLTTIMNVDLIDDQWFQASLPVGDGRFGSIYCSDADTFLLPDISCIHSHES